MKLAISIPASDAANAASADAMARVMHLLPEQEAEVFKDDGVGIATVTGGERFSPVPLRRQANGNLLAVSGAPLYLDGDLDRHLEGVAAGSAEDASRLLREMDGAFAAVFWDGRSRKLLVASDPMGLQPLYISQTQQGLLLATELKAFPAGGRVDIEMDPAGWGAFVTLGYTVGDATQLKGVRRFPPATIMTVDVDTGRSTTEEYWEWPRQARAERPEEVDTEAILDAMRRELVAYGRHIRDGVVLLSGGFDSRLALSLMKREGWSPSALVLGHRDELFGEDARLAMACARRLGVPTRRIDPPLDFYRKPAYLDYLVMNEVVTPSLYLFISQVQAYVDAEWTVAWDGTPPGYGLVPAFLPRGGFDVFLRHSCRSRDSFAWSMAEETFGRRRADEMFEAARDNIRRVTEAYPDDEMGVTMFEVYNRMRNRTSPNALKVYANKVFSCMLGVSRAFWDAAGSIPYEASRDYRLYLYLYRRHFPEVADIPFLSGGGLWCDETAGWAGRAAALRCAVAGSKPVHLLQKAWRRYVRRSRRYWKPSQYLALTRERMELDHPDLDADSVRRMSIDRRLPFYWQMWRWILSGRLTCANSETFFDQSAAP